MPSQHELARLVDIVVLAVMGASAILITVVAVRARR